MALGKKIGEFTLKTTSVTYAPGPGNAITAQVNLEGQTTGDLAGRVRGTLTAVGTPGAKSGTWTWCGVVLLANGEVVAGNGQGTGENIGNHKRRLRGVNHLSDGRTLAVESEADLIASTLNGTLY